MSVFHKSLWLGFGKGMALAVPPSTNKDEGFSP